MSSNVNMPNNNLQKNEKNNKKNTKSNDGLELKEINDTNNINVTKEDSDDNNINHYNAEWSEQHEKILIEWADKAVCYRWLHLESHRNYSFRNRWFTIPVIIMSTLTGTANFAQERVPVDIQPYYQLIVGSVNILAGIITTIQQFLKITEFNESHRVSSISWDKFYRNIKLELAKSRLERIPPYQMLKISKEEFDRLMETSPSIDKKIIIKFNNTFSGGPIKKNQELNEKQINFIELNKPAICDIIESTKKFVYKETERDIAKKNTKKIVNFVKENSEFRRKSIEVENFITTFSNKFNREPSVEEIQDNLNSKVDDKVINLVVNKN
jgi:hypothetical protein